MQAAARLEGQSLAAVVKPGPPGFKIVQVAQPASFFAEP
jgi:hypothetical protein